jgi:hypothetical protein
MAEHFEKKKLVHKNSQICILLITILCIFSKILFSAMLNVWLTTSLVYQLPSFPWPQTPRNLSLYQDCKKILLFSISTTRWDVFGCSYSILLRKHSCKLSIYLFYYNFCLVSYRWREKKIYFSQKWAVLCKYAWCCHLSSKRKPISVLWLLASDSEKRESFSKSFFLFTWIFL